MTKFPTFFYVIFLISQMNKAMSSEKLLDDQVDISIEYKTNGKSRLIEVYRSTNNALILANNQTIDYNKLEWYSYGLPFLTKIPQRKSMLSFRNVFEMTPTGFNIFVDFLTDWQKDLIKDRIKFKYGLDVNTNQIVKLKPSQFKCSIRVICDSDKVKVIEGYAHSFSDFPLKINFYMHKESRNCIESYLAEYQNIEIDCSFSKELKLEYFSVNTKELNVEGKLFGTENETYVTRERISDLASEIYNSFTVKERYDMSERDFNSSFFDALADLDFIPVAFNTVLKFFVKNSNDFQAIKYAYENTIKVNSSGDYIRFVIDNSAVNNISRLLSNNRSFGLNYIRNEIERGFRSVVENENSGKSLQIQLKELNERSNVEWEIEGKKVIPKSLIASKLLKSAIKFDRIKKKTPKSILEKHYSFEFKDENIKYDHMKEQSIKKENLKILKTISSVKSLFDCLEECENLNDCHYVEKSDTSNCYLFDKTADLKLERKDNDKTDLYHKKKFEKVEIHGEKVNEYLSSLNHMGNAEECWTECLSEKECEAISYDTETLDCYLSKVVNNTIETNEISNFLTVTYARFLNLNNGKMNILGQTKLINHYRNIRSNSLSTCQSECLEDSERCSAVSYRNRTCLMFKSGDYLAERKFDWESALLDELNVAHMVRYNQLELTGNLKTIDSDSEYLCWNECLKLSECFAITFELDKNKCRFIGKSWYVAKRNRNAVTLALETEEIVYKKINVALKEISTYKDSRSVAEFLSGPTIAFNFDWRILVKLSGYGDYRYVGVYLFPYQEPQIENIHVNYDLIIVNMNDYSKSKISSISHYFTNNFYGHQTFIKLKDLLNDIEFSMGDELHVQAVIKKIEWEPFSQPQFIYNRTKLLNHYRSIKASSYSACWEECLEDSKTTSAKKCKAISYKDRTCLMFNDVSFLAERIDGWKTVSLDEIKSSPVVRYNQLELSGNLKTILNSESEYSCWSECLKYSECIAVTFEVEKNKCELARNSGYVTRRNKKAVTLALETETITYMTINFKVNEVSKYTKWTNLTTVISDTTRAFDIDWTVTVSFSGYISRYIGLFLTPNQSPKIENYHVSYELAILNSSDVKKSESYIFEKYFPDNNARGYLEFYYLKDLMNDSNLFSNDSFLVQAVVTKIEWESNTEKQFSYNRTKLINSYKNSTAKSFEGCWEECIEDTDHCIAVSYSQMSCLMFKRGQFLVERNDSWKTVSLEEIISTPIVRYDQLELSGNLKTIETESEYSCWNECLKHSSCFAVTFELNINKCSLIGKHGYSTKRNKNAVSFASEKEKIVYLTIDLKVNEVSTYKDWTNLTYANSNVTRAFDIDWKIAVGFSGNIKRSVGLYLYANQWPRKENYRVNFELILVDTNDYRKSKAYSYEQFFDENIGWGSSDIIQLDTLMKNNDVFSSDSDSFQVRALVTRIQWQPKELEIDWDI